MGVGKGKGGRATGTEADAEGSEGAAPEGQARRDATRGSEVRAPHYLLLSLLPLLLRCVEGENEAAHLRASAL